MLVNSSNEDQTQESAMIRPAATNREFELGGVNHVALMCSDMARTVAVTP